MLKKYYNLIKNFSNWNEYFRYKRNKLSSIKLITRRKNIIIEVPRKLMGVFKEIFFEDFYNENLLKKITNPNPIVVDIGANAGYFSFFISNILEPKQILCFEPFPKNYTILLENFSFNPKINKEIFSQAVSAPGVKSIELNIDEIDEFTVIASQFNSLSSGRKKIEVECIDLGTVIEKNNLEKIDLLKMDCEGSEYDILYTLSEKYWNAISAITMEVHQLDAKDKNLNSLKSFLNKKNLLLKTKSINKETSMLWAWKK